MTILKSIESIINNSSNNIKSINQSNNTTYNNNNKKTLSPNDLHNTIAAAINRSNCYYDYFNKCSGR